MSTASEIKKRLSQESRHWKRNGSEYLGPAPSEIRVGSDSQSFHVTFESDEFGRFKDFVSGEGGSLYTLAEKLGIELPKRVAGRQTSAPRSLSEYEASKSLPAGYLAKRGWVEGLHQNRPCIFIPVDDETRQVRFLDGEKPKFTWEDFEREKEEDGKGKMAFYGSRVAKQIVNEKNLNFMVWTNGAPSVEVMQYFGIPAFAVVGGENNIARKIYTDRVLKAFGGTIFIALDCDKTGKEGAEKLAKLLGERGLIIDLGGSDGFDGADFANLWGEASLPRLIDLADKTHDERPPRTAIEAANAVMNQLEGNRKVRGRFVRNPFSKLSGFGGGASFMHPDLLTGVVALSGHGKTSFWHSIVKMLMVDPRKWGFMVDSREFIPEVDHVRRLQSEMNSDFSYDDIIRHLVALQEAEEGVPSYARYGKLIRNEELDEIKAIHDRFKATWKGTLEFAEEYLYIEDTLDYMKRRTLEIREKGGFMDVWIFDYLTLFRCKPALMEGVGENLYNIIVQAIKDAARSVNVHAIVMLQPNKTPTGDAIAKNRRLTVSDIGYVNQNHFNTIIGLNTLYGTQAVWETGFDNIAGGGTWVVAGYDPATGDALVDKALLKDGCQACIIEVLKNTFGKTGFAPIKGDFSSLQWLDEVWTNEDLRLPLDAGS